MEKRYIAFWNLENLFDVEDSPRRSEKLQRTIGGELRGWDEATLNNKVQQLAKVIRAMNYSQGPDLLGVCEVENTYVLNLLANAVAQEGAMYDVVHHDMHDNRGIDVAFLVKRGQFAPGQTFSHEILKRSATRDLFQVNLTTNQDINLIVIGNHWPSRSGGKYLSEPYRMMAGETLAYFHERIQSIYGNDVAVLAMGDFNDEPFDQSLTDYALSERNENKVLNARSPKFLNLMWDILGQSEATYYYQNSPNLLDQFLVSKGLVSTHSGIRANPDSVHIVRYPGLVEEGDYPVPIPFGRKDSVNVNGFSDHSPVAMELEIL